MLNYQKKYRESLDKSKRKSTIKKQSINKSHASSINLKISQDLSTFDPIKISLRNNPSNLNNQNSQNLNPQHSKSKANIKHQMSNANLKYSFKIQNDQQNLDVRSRIKTNYDNIVRPFQESNRCLITERKNKPDANIKMTDRSHSKGRLQLKTQYRQSEEYQIFYEKQEIQNDKLRRDMSTKHTNQSSSSNQFIKVSVSQLTKLMEQYTMYKNNVAVLQKQVEFYRKNSGKQGKNSVCLALGL